MRSRWLTIIVLIFAMRLTALTLKECLEASERNCTIKDNLKTYSDMEEMEMQMVQSGYFPQLYLGSNYHLQSESTEVALSGLPFEVDFPEQTQYGWSFSFQMQQLVYDGGIIKRKKKLNSLQKAVQRLGIEGQILHRKLNTAAYYYGILISQRQMDILELHNKYLTAELAKANAVLKAGMIEKTSILQLEEQKLQISEEMITLEHKKSDYLHKLESLTGETILKVFSALPELEEIIYPSAARSPELEITKVKRDMELEQSKLSGSGLLPKVNIAAMAGYGTPGYDIFSDDPHDYYQASINLSWYFWDWYSRSKKMKLHKQQAEVHKRELTEGEENLQLRIDECDMEIVKYNERLEILKERSLLLKKVSDDYASKLAAGTVSSSEYLQQFRSYKSCELEIAALELQKEFTAVKKLLIMGGTL